MDKAKAREMLEKVQNLMKNAGTVGEAESAAAAMERLMMRHNISAEELASLGKEEKEQYGSVFIRVAPDRKPGIQWRLNLIYVLAEYGFCTFIRHGVHGGTGVVVGQPTNIETVRVMFQTTMDTIDRITEQEWFGAMNRTGSGSAMAWKNSFRLGFVSGLYQKMDLERQAEVQENTNVTALVSLKSVELAEAVDREVGKVVTHKGSAPTNRDGFRRGVEKGRAHDFGDRLVG